MSVHVVNISLSIHALVSRRPTFFFAGRGVGRRETIQAHTLRHNFTQCMLHVTFMDVKDESVLDNTKKMLILLLILHHIVQCHGIIGLSPINVNASIDCGIRNLAYQYAQKLLPQYGQFQAVYDALQLHNCNISLSSGKQHQVRPFRYQSYKEGVEIFVDAVNGDDSHNGDIDHPLKSIEKALRLFRSQAVKSATTIYLRKGTYYLKDTIRLAITDSGLTLAGYKDEAPVISGGKLYSFTWKPHQSKVYPDLKIFTADLSQQSPVPFNQLFIKGRRAVRARYPNGNPETTGLHTHPTGYFADAEKWYTKLPAAGTPLVLDNPIRNGTHFPYFSLGLGGSVSVFDPPESYFGTTDPNSAHTYLVPYAMQYPANVSFVNRTWSEPSTGELHTFQGERWGNWIFQIDSRNESAQKISWSKGGFQVSL